MSPSHRSVVYFGKTSQAVVLRVTQKLIIYTMSTPSDSSDTHCVNIEPVACDVAANCLKSYCAADADSKPYREHDTIARNFLECFIGVQHSRLCRMTVCSA